jgi:TolB-like protein/DNA-binding winged helix-turn-helix (wHTH) protein
MAAVLHTPHVHCYEFGEFRLILEERLLLRGDEPVALPPKVFDVLVILIENEGHLIEKNSILDTLWPDTFIEEATLARTISSLRKILGECPENKFIETVPKRGYRFVAPVRTTIEEAHTSLPPAQSGLGEEDLNERKLETGTMQPVAPPSMFVRLLSRPVLVFSLVVVSLVMTGLMISWSRLSASTSEMKSIAVLPFDRIGEGERDETLEFGMADTLITRLSGLKRMIVRPTSSVSKYAGQKTDAATAGRDLQVDAVLEGSIQKSGDRVRVNVRLINVVDGSSLWAEKFDTAFTNIFTIQDSISEQVVAALLPQLNSVGTLAGKRPTDNAEAYRLYLQGVIFGTSGRSRA